METETRDLLKSIGSNAAGTVLGAGVIALLVFFAGKVNFLVTYWKEALGLLLLTFVMLTVVVWFRKILRIEKELEVIKNFSNHNRETDAVRKIRSDLIRILNIISNGNTSRLKYVIVELEIERFRSNGQIGEISKLIEKLQMDVEREDKHSIRDTLMEIREYIKKGSMPHYYVEDLNKVLKLVEEDFSILANEIKVLSQEKLRKV